MYCVFVLFCGRMFVSSIVLFLGWAKLVVHVDSGMSTGYAIIMVKNVTSFAHIHNCNSITCYWYTLTCPLLPAVALWWTIHANACLLSNLDCKLLGGGFLFLSSQRDGLGGEHSMHVCVCACMCMFSWWLHGSTVYYIRLISQETPAESRSHNQECVFMKFYDNHDVWHFFSACAMFFSFLVSRKKLCSFW